MRVLRPGFTLVELLIVIAIISTLLGLLIPAINTGGRTPVRGNLCKNNLRQLSIALVTREISHHNLPGYINSIGPDDGHRTRASWVVTTLPYLEQAELWDQWSAGQPEFASIEIFLCPSDPPAEDDAPNTSYSANAGYIGDSDKRENRANGLFFDNTRTAEGAAGPGDERDANHDPRISLSFSYLQAKGDGSNNTLMLAENANALYWGYVTKKDREQTKDRNYHFGFCWEQPAVVRKEVSGQTIERFRRINSSEELREIKSFAEMSPEVGFPSRNHPGGINVAFAGGAIQFVSDQVDPLVYAQLMTSNHRLSDLVDANGTPDKELPPPSEGDY